MPAQHQPLKRAYGRGSVRFEAGKWRVRASVAGRRVDIGRFNTRQEALSALAQRLNEPAARFSFATFGEQWIEKLARAGHRNVRSWRSYWHSLVSEAPFAASPPGEITRADVRDWLRSLPSRESRRSTGRREVVGTGRKLSRQSAVHALGLVRRAFAEAVEDGLCGDNPAEGLRLPPWPRTPEPWTYLTLDELAALERAPLAAGQRAALLTAIYTGVRQGELFALRWEHVDLGERPGLRVLASWSSPPKSGRSRRVPLIAPAVEVLRAWWRASGEPSLGLVFPAPGGAMFARGYDAGWAPAPGRPGAARAAGITRHVRFHDLRHTFAAHLVSGSWGPAWSLAEVGEVLGHTTVAVTERYAHLAPERLDARAAATTGLPQTLPQGRKAQNRKGKQLR